MDKKRPTTNWRPGMPMVPVKAQRRNSPPRKQVVAIFFLQSCILLILLPLTKDVHENGQHAEHIPPAINRCMFNGGRSSHTATTAVSNTATTTTSHIAAATTTSSGHCWTLSSAGECSPGTHPHQQEKELGPVHSTDSDH